MRQINGDLIRRDREDKLDTTIRDTHRQDFGAWAVKGEKPEGVSVLAC